MRRARRIFRPLQSTFVLALVFLAVGGGLAETGLRLAESRWELPIGIVGSGNPCFDVTFARMVRFTDRRGVPDIVCVGSSMIKTAIDPDILDAEIGRRTGRRCSSFNFGVAGFNAAGAVQIVDLLNRENPPRLVVFDASPAAFLQADNPRLVSTEVGRSAWFRQRTGRPSVSGFLIDETELFKFFLRARMFLEAPEDHFQIGHWERRVRFDGFDARRAPGGDSAAVKVTGGSRASRATPLSLALLDGLLSRYPNVVLVSSPVHRAFLAHYPGGESSYHRTASEIAAVAERFERPFIDRPSGLAIPDSMWINANHLDAEGAAAFTTWLAGKLESSRHGLPRDVGGSR